MTALRARGQLSDIQVSRPGSHLAPLWWLGRGPCLLNIILAVLQKIAFVDDLMILL